MMQKVFMLLLVASAICIIYFTAFITIATKSLPRPKVRYLLKQDQASPIPIEAILEEVPQLAARSFRDEVFGWNKTCAQFPNVLDLDINNRYWQTLRSSNGTFHLFGAYLDDRLGDNDKYVRILGMLDRIEPIITTYCQLWASQDRTLIIAQVESYEFIRYKGWANYDKGDLHPYMISCKLPPNASFIPASVSLVERKCDKSTTNLRINYNKPGKVKEVAVCMKGPNFLHEDELVRLVEWIELMRVLGVEKIYMYEFSSHPNVSLVLEYYKTLGNIDVTPLTLPAGLPNTPTFQAYLFDTAVSERLKNELIPYNDCIYKHMYEYKYIAVMDVDEVIMPKRVQNYSELLRNLNAMHHNVTTYYAHNAYFLNDMHQETNVPEYMHILQHVERSKIITEPHDYIKGFHNTKHVVTLQNHFPIHCFKACNNHTLDIEDALMHHYREDCSSELGDACLKIKKDVQVDNTVWKYRKELEQRVSEVLNNFGLIT